MNIVSLALLRSDGIRLLVWLAMQPLLWAVAGVTLGPYLFYRGFRMLQLKRRIINTPRSSIRSAAMGMVEVSGKAVGPYTLVGPLSKEECLYYRLVVVNDQNRTYQNKIQQACAPFYVDDGTGVLMVYPPNSDLRLEPSHQVGSLGGAMEGYKYGNDPEFVQEFCIKPGDTIFALGTLQENRWAKTVTVNNDDWDDEMTRIGPGFISETEADFLRREAFPFLSADVPSGVTVETTQKFDLSPPVILSNGNGPFIISSDSEREMLAKLSWSSLLYIWGGPVAALWGIWELLVVRPGLIGSPLSN